MKEVYRKEKKFLLNLKEQKKHMAWLEKIMIQDEHNGKDGYIIRSLYFDTINDNDYEGKELGLEVRRKIRLRVYSPKQDFAMLEIKQKTGDWQLKRSLKLSREDAIEFINGNYEILLKYKNPFAAECYGIMQVQCYRPKTVVEYKRKAFIAKENDIRITFDYDIKTNEINYNIFDENLVLNSAFNQNNTILEIKYNRFLLSYIKDLIEKVDRGETSVSKYCLGRKITKYYNYM